jgi:hypothetical protein
MKISTKIDNNFYDRFMELKPKDMVELDWFAQFGWNIEQIRQKKSDWRKLEIPRPETIIEIQKVLTLSLEEIVRLQYGTRITFPAKLRAGGDVR